MRRRAARLLAIAMLAAGMTACSTGYKDLPLPGSGVGGDTYQISAVFDQALNLAEGAQVKSNGVYVGRVHGVTAKDFQAHITMDIKESVEIPVDSSARLRYDTPLGELFVEVTPGKSEKNLEDDDQFPVRNTMTAPSVEDALAAASTLINGGRLGELQVIAEELTAAVGGREDEIKASLRRVASFLQEANASTGDISRTLESLRSVSRALANRRGTIRRALREVGPAVETLGKDTDEVVALLEGAEVLARTARRLAIRIDDPLLTVLQQLGPVADSVLSTRSRFSQGLDDLIALARQLQIAIPGETLPMQLLIHLDQTTFNVFGDGAFRQRRTNKGGDDLLSGPLESIGDPSMPQPGDQPLLPGLDLLMGASR